MTAPELEPRSTPEPPSVARRGRVRALRDLATAAVVSGAALLLALALQPIAPLGPSLTFLAAVALTAWSSGRVASLAVTAMSALMLDYFFERPPFTLWPDELQTVLEVGVFTFVGLLVSSVNSSLRTARERAEVAHAESERRRLVAKALRDTLTRVTSARSLSDVLAAIAREAETLLGTNAAAIYELAAPAGPLRMRAGVGLAPGVVPDEVPLGISWVGEAVAGRLLVAEPDTRAAVRRSAAWPEGTGRRPVRERIAEHYGAVLALPLIARSKVLGGLGLYYECPRGFSDEDLALATAFADEAALAIESAALRAAAAANAAVAERNRIARELHDSVSQALYGIGLGARAARALLDRDPPRAAEPLDYVVSLAEAALTEMRALLIELRPEILATDGLVAALRKQAASLQTRHGIEVDVHLGSEPDVPVIVKEAAYRIAQEALHNVAKHARAQRAYLRLRTNGAEMCLEIADDGVGFDPSLALPGHLGLDSMRERARELGGRLEVESGAGGGTRVRATLPVAGSLEIARSEVADPPPGYRAAHR